MFFVKMPLFNQISSRKERFLHPAENGKSNIVLFHLEFQNKIHLGYKIIKRGIYYVCRIVSDEKGKQFKGSDYNRLKKVFSLWLCPCAPLKYANSSVSYDLCEHLRSGSAECLSKDKKAFDLLELMIIYMNQTKPPPEGTGFALLHTLLTDSLSSKKRYEILRRDYNIVIDKEEQEMFDLIKFAKENGRKEGRKEGRNLGRKEGRNLTYKQIISRMIKIGKTTEEICEDLGLTPAQIEKYNTTIGV
ncbi:MAG: hypothetical protein J6X55_15775 [Victivallales bacterium]|nr:hypothetical protein [Victivallales bacterium]